MRKIDDSYNSMIGVGFKKLSIYVVAIFACFGFLISMTQAFGESPDYNSYNSFFDLVRSERLDIFSISRFEPGFSFLSLVLTTLFSENIIVYSFFVVSALLIKGWVIRGYSSSLITFLIVLAFYFARYFPLHELTQIREAYAIAFLLVATVFLWAGSRFYGFVACGLSIGS
jgi:hypothetical protein